MKMNGNRKFKINTAMCGNRAELRFGLFKVEIFNSNDRNFLLKIVK